MPENPVTEASSDPLPLALHAMPIGRHVRFVAVSVLLLALVVALAGIGFLLHLNLSSAGFLELLIILIAAMRLGFAQATVMSLGAFLCLNFLFTEPVFTFTVNDPQNWVALFTFEATALLVSGLSNRIRLHTEQAEQQRRRATKLYEFSRAVLLIDRRSGTAEQLSRLTREIFQVDDVHFWISDNLPAAPLHVSASNLSRDESLVGISHRPLNVGGELIGRVVLRGWQVDPLVADAVASIAAITFERLRAIERENRAEMERDTESLRSTVLDALAHGFKTPLTAIQTASSGLLAIADLTSAQNELVSIIDERVTMLSQMTTHLLRTAALEAREVAMKPEHASLPELLQALVLKQEDALRERIEITLPPQTGEDHFDRTLIELALQQLLDNAARYSAGGTPIRLSVERHSAETLLHVGNTANGQSLIQPQERTRIFERFQRGLDAMHGPSGTGLGLSIVKKIAAAHGGRAWVECDGPATRFTLAIAHHQKEPNA